jgi:8-oxo-dGTP diphosphatase
VWRNYPNEALGRLLDCALAIEERVAQAMRDNRLQFWRPAEHPTRLLTLLFAALAFICAWSVGLWIEWRTPLAFVGPLLIPMGVIATVRLIASSSSRHSLSVAAVIIDDDGPAAEVLMIRRRDNGHWQPPGGRIDADETIAAGLIREVREETGFYVVPTMFSGAYRHVDTRVLALVFICEVTGGRMQEQSRETTDCQWLTLDALSDRMDPAFSVRVYDAIWNHERQTMHYGRVGDHSGVTQLTAGKVATAATAVDLSPIPVSTAHESKNRRSAQSTVPLLPENSAAQGAEAD